MEMASEAYTTHLAALVREGAVPESVVDEAVRRVLRLKLQLGLFEHPYTDEALADQILLRDDFRALALQVACESIVLLKNEGGLLPLSPGEGRIAVIGPLADARHDLLGCWASNGRAEDVESVLDGMAVYLGSSDRLAHVSGCPVKDEGPADIPAAVAAAHEADVVVLVVGESANMSGEARSRSHLGLPGRQQELLDAIAQTDKPIVGVLVTGRPLVIPRMAGQVDALLVAWHGGIRAGRAVADLLFGAAVPSGKLTASWPRTEGQIPVYYAQKSTGRPMEGAGTTQFFEPFKSRYIDEPNDPLFSFGYGLSYTTFDYSDLEVHTPLVDANGTLVVSARVANTGPRAGTEVVQLYVRDLVASVTRPVKELKGFQRVTLQAGEAQTVRFELPADQLGFPGLDMRRVVEPGAFQVWVGPDSAAGLEGHFEVQ